MIKSDHIMLRQWIEKICIICAFCWFLLIIIRHGVECIKKGHHMRPYSSHVMQKNRDAPVKVSLLCPECIIIQESTVKATKTHVCITPLNHCFWFLLFPCGYIYLNTCSQVSHTNSLYGMRNDYVHSELAGSPVYKACITVCISTLSTTMLQTL
jgi:hypothetical protein